MSLAIFVIGVLVFLVTVYGTVVAGGLLLTSRQLEVQPELIPDDEPVVADESTTDRARHLITTTTY